MSVSRRPLVLIWLLWGVLAIGPAEETGVELPARFSIAAPPAGLPGLKPLLVLPTSHTEVVESAPLGPESLESGLSSGRVAAVPPTHSRGTRTGNGARPEFAADILLLIQRQNE